jgi:hypothetical protein
MSIEQDWCFYTWRTLVREGGLEQAQTSGQWSKPSTAPMKLEKVNPLINLVCSARTRDLVR